MDITLSNDGDESGDHYLHLADTSIYANPEACVIAKEGTPLSHKVTKVREVIDSFPPIAIVVAERFWGNGRSYKRIQKELGVPRSEASGYVWSVRWCIEGAIAQTVVD